MTQHVTSTSRSGEMTYINSGSALDYGQIVVVGGIVGSVKTSGGIAAGGTGTLVIDGLFVLSADSTVWTQDQEIYWQPTGNPVSGTAGSGAASTTAAGGTLIGPADSAKATDGTTGRVFNTSMMRAALGLATYAAGASTAAAGSTTSDAGVLPAATARVYPTTAADGTKGVRIHASDKVTGRTISIGNGVSTAVLKIYPPSGGTINGGSADAAVSTVSGRGMNLYCLSSGSNTWLTL